MNCTSLPFTHMHCIAINYTVLHYSALNCIAQHWIVLNCIEISIWTQTKKGFLIPYMVVCLLLYGGVIEDVSAKLKVFRRQFGKLVLFGSVGGNWWDLFYGGKKVGEQYGSFLHRTCQCTHVDPKLVIFFVKSAFVPREYDQSWKSSRFLEEC